MYEKHYVTTKDGYINMMVYISPPGEEKGNRPAVMLVHGFVDSSDSYILNT